MTPAANTTQGGNFDRDKAVAEQRAQADADFKMQLQMMDLQRQVNAQSQYVTAMSSLEKAKTDSMMEVARNFKP